MLRLSLILALIIAILAVVFALQNAHPITIQFLFWQIQGSLALVVLLTAALGAVVGLLVSVPNVIRRNRRITHQKHRIEELQASLDQQIALSRATPTQQQPEQRF